MSSRLSTESRNDSLALFLALEEMSKCLRVKQMNRPSVPVRGAPGAPYKGKPRTQVRADISAGVARTVATSGPLTASVTAAWRVPSIHSCALLPGTASVSSMEACHFDQVASSHRASGTSPAP